MTWGMLPSLGSAMCACTWHFFYNAPSLEFLVALQAGSEQGTEGNRPGAWALHRVGQWGVVGLGAVQRKGGE